MKTSFIEIVNWFNSERNYTQGVALFSMFSRNKGLSHYLKGDETPQRMEKLTWELHKIAGLPEEVCYKPETITDFMGTIPEMPVPVKVVVESPKSKLYLEPVEDLIKEKGFLFNARDIEHRELSAMSEVNNDENNLKRKQLIESIDKKSDQIQKITAIIDHFKETGEIENQKENTEVKIEPGNISEIYKFKRLNNLRTYKSKVEKILKDIPDGPKKVKYQEKYDAIIAEIKELDDTFQAK